ncbi:MAG: DUF87 domain-containing protein [Chloroflexota bacterium]|nr:DUF87 domain-containing protein [Chloroflexota bacterium]
MPLIEKLGSFFLGHEYDLTTKKALPDRPVNYDSRDLTTHAVCVGMTGSGKTGLCISLLEEAALDNVPAIIIDPKGDMTNLLLTFPDLRPEDFLPWVNPDDASRKGQTPEEFAAKTAQTWRDGLASWDEGADRIRMLKDAADFAIYTPGSDSGLPVNILSSFKAPSLDWESESETLRERILGTVSALLGLVGIDADPVRSREHILLSNILENAWRAGKDLDIPKLIMSVQKPPFRQVGILDVESFYPEKDRFALAMALNNIIASPSFGSWLTGEPLDIASMLHTATGKPRHSIFYIAHLSDAERMFFVTILLEQIISWMRAQPGTTSLRALVYMDEIFGFFPPVAEPPSKRPMLTLMKQARAFGVGMVLTTQNPVDLDYKGLANAGTWFVGKLQTDRDKARLLEGLGNAMVEGGSGTMADTRVLDQIISSLDSRVFLLHDVHQSGSIVFTTRWAMSYLRGPLTRQQIKVLMAARKAGSPATTRASAVAGTPAGLVGQPPVLPPGIKQAYLPISVREDEAVRAQADRAGSRITPSEKRLVYQPAVLGLASIRFSDRKLGVDENKDYSLLLPSEEGAGHLSWKDAVPVDVNPRDLEDRPAGDALFVASLPSELSSARSLQKLEDDFADHLYRNESFNLASNPTLKLYARPGESERDFSVRCQQAAREQRDTTLDQIREKYQVKLKRLEDKLANQQQRLEQDKSEYKGRMGEEVLSGLASVAGALGIFGRKSGSLRGLSTAATKRRLTSSAKADIAEAEADIARLQAEVDDIKSQMEQDAGQLTKQWAAAAGGVQSVKIIPKKTDIDVQMVVLAWAPAWEMTYEDARGRGRTETVPGYSVAAAAR